MQTILMPQVKSPGEKLTVFSWQKKPGQTVAKGDVLLKVEFSEGLAEVASGLSGTLGKVLAPKGTTLAAGSPIAELAETGERIPPAKSEQVATPSSPTATPNAERKQPMGKVTPIVMPKAGQSMEEGTITKWRVVPGTAIKKGDIIFEIETDKATLEVEAVDEGRLAKIVLPEGGTVKVLEPVAYLADSDADVEALLAGQEGAVKKEEAVVPTVARQEVKLEATLAAPAVREDGRVKASPAARKIAGERGVDLASVPAGSGPGGRILSTDVPAPATAAAKQEAIKPVVEGEVVRKRMSPMRKAIARNLLASKQSIPHFYIKTTINADPMYAFYQQEKAKYPCSLNDLVVAGCAKALMEFSAFRSRIDKNGEEFVEFPSANIGIAVGMDDGLVVPVLVGTEQMTLRQIGSETKRLAVAARGGKIEGMGKGVFTITNLGMFGVEEFSAIINPPEAAILAVGAIREEVIVSGGTLRPGRVMTMTLSADHRIVDGVLAAKFMARLKEILEYPQQLA